MLAVAVSSNHFFSLSFRELDYKSATGTERLHTWYLPGHTELQYCPVPLLSCSHIAYVHI